MRQRLDYKLERTERTEMKKRIIRGCLRIAILAVVGGVLGWLNGTLFGERALVTDTAIAVTLGAGIGILLGVVLFPEKA